MKAYALDLWRRAREALRTARHDLPVSADAASSRAYYAAFYAVSALLALEGESFAKHATLEAAVHRDLVKTGRWPKEMGKDFSALAQLRVMADYGGAQRVPRHTAQEAVEKAERILANVQQTRADVFVN